MRALEDFGMAMGILAVFDMAGVDVGVKARRANPEHVPKDDPTFYRASQVLFDQDWLGQKSGKGYYRYEAGSRERLTHDEALQLLAEEGRKLGVARGDADQRRQEIVERCIFAMINEGAKMLEEGVALRPGDIDVVYTSGYGFPRRRGGPMFYADQIGLDTVLAGLDKYAQVGQSARLAAQRRCCGSWRSRAAPSRPGPRRASRSSRRRLCARRRRSGGRARQPVPVMGSDSFASASSMVKVFGLCIGGKLVEGFRELRRARLRRIDEIGVVQEPVVVRVRGDVRELVRIGAQVEQLRHPQSRERLGPDLHGSLAALLHEHQLPVVVAHGEHVAVVAEVEEAACAGFPSPCR